MSYSSFVDQELFDTWLSAELLRFVSCWINAYWLSLLIETHLTSGFWMKQEMEGRRGTASCSLGFRASCVERFSGELRTSESTSGFIPAKDRTTAIFVARSSNNKATLRLTLGFIQERNHSRVQNVGDVLKTRVWRTSMWSGVKLNWEKLRVRCLVLFIC